MTKKFKTIPDTNIIVAAQSKNPQSPNREYYERWIHKNEFDLLYSEDTLFEYALKLKQKAFPKEKRKALIKAISKLGIRTQINYFHLPVYPEDADDTAFLLCAENGKATHLISYDNHLLELAYRHTFEFKICKMIPFLQELRQT